MQKKRELLFSLTKKDFIIEPYKGSGKGGQHRNKTMSCVRMKHPESGAEAIGTEHREQSRNRALAFRRLVETPRFRAWHRMKTQEILQGKRAEETLDKKAEEAMKPENIKTEVWNTEMGKWVVETEQLDEDKNKG